MEFTEALKAELEALFNKILEFVLAILKVEMPEVGEIID